MPPSQTPLQEASDTDTDADNASGSDIVNSTDVSHPLASVTVVVYVPAVNSVKSSVV